MRHLKHKYSLGVKKEHRSAMIANLAAALFRHGRIQTTLIKAKALRPFAERIISFAKQAFLSENRAEKLHCLRLSIARVHDKNAVRRLFDPKVAQEFANRNGGYTRIYKMIPRIGDASPRGIIELLDKNGERLLMSSAEKQQKVDAAANSAEPAAKSDGNV